MAAAITAGAAAAALVAAGAFRIMSPKTKKSPPPSPQQHQVYTEAPRDSDFSSAQPKSYLAEAHPPRNRLTRGAPLKADGLLREKAASFMADYDYTDTSSAGYQDQQWAFDCGQKGACPFTPFNSARDPPEDYQHVGIPEGELGDYAPGIVHDTNRDASGELNVVPHPTRRYPDYGLGWGEPLESSYIPYGGKEATDLEFWGPTDWNSVRHSRIPSYATQRETELDGKEINRPMNDYFGDFTAGEDETAVEFSSGWASARSADVRLQGLNRYGSFVTTKRPDENLLNMGPTQNGKIGSMPTQPPGRSLGARIITTFNAFKPWRDMGLRDAPPIMAAIQLPAASRNPYTYEERAGNSTPWTTGYGSEDVNKQRGARPGKRLLFNQWMAGGNLPPGGGAPAGPETNPVQGGVMRRIAGQWDTMGNARFEFAANSGTEQNPPEGGYHYTTRQRIKPDSETMDGMTPYGGGGPIRLHNMAAGARGQKDISGRADYQAPGGGLNRYEGPTCAGKFLQLHPMAPWAFPRGGSRTAGGGNGGSTGMRGVWTLHGNAAIGVRGTDWSDEPPVTIGEAGNNPMQASILDRRSEASLSDVFDVAHS